MTIDPEQTTFIGEVKPTKTEALFQHAQTGNVDGLRETLDAGGNVHATKNGATLLTTAIKGYNTSAQLVQLLIDKGASVNAKDSSGETPLHVAATLVNAMPRVDAAGKPEYNEGYVEIVKALLDAGANPNVQDRHGNTPMHSATTKMPYSTPEGEMHHGASGEVISLLMEKGGDLNIANKHGTTPNDNLDRQEWTKSRKATEALAARGTGDSSGKGGRY